MPEHPLLIFPTPQTVDRTKRKPHFPKICKPSMARQAMRLSPMFSQLQISFAARRVEIQQNIDGIDPEEVLVIETIGSIEKFANAVKHISGLEWLGEIETDDISPDEDFYNTEDPKKNLNGRLFLIMSNQVALNQLISLWEHYRNDPNIEFQRGLAKFKNVFSYLKDIRRWDVQDRLSETGILQKWHEELEYGEERSSPFEIELWFRGNEELRAASENTVMDLVQEAGGRVLGQSIIEGIAYHALLAELPINSIHSIVNNFSTRLVKCDDIMFFRPVGQIVTGTDEPEGEAELIQSECSPLPSGKPVIALFDGLPIANHDLLGGRITIDDPDNWEDGYEAQDRVHGTAMASLIIHGDLNSSELSLSRPIYIRPIMKPIDWLYNPRPERVPQNCLVVDLIHRAVIRLFEGSQGENAVAPQIKIVNLSIGDPLRQFIRSMSPLARLLDWLSVKYNILFIVSAGNHAEDIDLGISTDEFAAFQNDELQKITIKALYRDFRNRRLFSPAETINGLTIGALHSDEATIHNHGALINLINSILPSPVSAFGSGYRRSIKPDFICPGGRQLYRTPPVPDNPVSVEIARTIASPGNKTAYPGHLAGELNATAYSRGTSNATALVTRAAGICYDYIIDILNEQAPDIDTSFYETSLLKALLVHGCSWKNMDKDIAAAIHTNEDKTKLDGMVRKWVGYGIPNFERVLNCTRQRATILGFGKLSDGKAHEFKLPLPPSLSVQQIKRRLTITLAWLSPIAPKTQKYRTASLWFEVGNNSLAKDRKNTDWQAVRRGTVQHEIFEGDSAYPFTDGEIIKIKVNCKEDAGKIVEPIAYGLAVTLEVAESLDIDIYDEIRTRIRPTIQIQPTNI